MYHQRSSYLWEKTYLWPEKDVHLWRHLNKEEYGPVVPEHISNIAPGHNTIIQAGGACGMYADYYSRYFKNVYTVEPDRDNFHCLTANAGAPNVYKMNYALGAEDQTVMIHNDRRNFGATHITDQTGVEVRMITIDQLGLAPDVIHLDVEGYETEILKGAHNTIMEHTPLIVLETADEYVTDVLGYSYIGEIGADQIFFKKNEKKVI